MTTPLSFRLLAFSLFRFHSCTPTSVHPQAAGLTLTVARRIILLEPFRKPGEEAQALNRFCQQRGVTTTGQNKAAALDMARRQYVQWLASTGQLADVSPAGDNGVGPAK